MASWADGYLVDLDYILGYYKELNPLRLRMAFLFAGLHLPKITTACELGFGLGMSINTHASATNIDWYGTDFNPAQAGFAQEMAMISENDAKLYEQSFAEFCSRSDLPDFDFIGLHGIWSWISDDNRAVIIDFIRRKLKPGGVAYISYNTMPGWATMLPVRQLFCEHIKSMGGAGHGITASLSSALDFSEKLLASNPRFLHACPDVADRIKSMRSLSPAYLVGEYLNDHWLPMNFSEAMEQFTHAKLKFACSAYYLDFFDDLNLGKEQQQLLNEIPEPTFRETVRDFCVNRQFRRDYYVKGSRKLTPFQQSELLKIQRVILVRPRSGIQLKLNGGVLGEFDMQASIYNPILDVLADHQIKSICQIEQELVSQGIILSQIFQAIMILIGQGVLEAAQEDLVCAAAKPKADRLNALCFKKICDGENLSTFASPVTGGAVSISFPSILFLSARSQGKNKIDDWVEFAWSHISRQNKFLVKDGHTLETEAENIAELVELAKEFLYKELPIIDALGISV
jgi:SAM-dependent methyltransferase